MSQEHTIKLTVGQEEYVKEDHSQQDCVIVRAIMEINEAFISYTYKDVTTIYPYQCFFFLTEIKLSDTPYRVFFSQNLS